MEGRAGGRAEEERGEREEEGEGLKGEGLKGEGGVARREVGRVERERVACVWVEGLGRGGGEGNLAHIRQSRPDSGLGI